MPRRCVVLIAVATDLPTASQGAQEDRRHCLFDYEDAFELRAPTLTGSRRLCPRDPTLFVAAASLLRSTSTPCDFLDHTTSSL